MSMVAARPGPQRHRIAELVFALDVGPRCRGLQGPEDLTAAIRRELLPAIETALRAIEVEVEDLMIDEIELDLGETPEEPDWSELRARLHGALVAALTARIVSRAPDISSTTSRPAPIAPVQHLREVARSQSAAAVAGHAIGTDGLSERSLGGSREARTATLPSDGVEAAIPQATEREQKDHHFHTLPRQEPDSEHLTTDRHRLEHRPEPDTLLDLETHEGGQAADKDAGGQTRPASGRRPRPEVGRERGRSTSTDKGLSTKAMPEGETPDPENGHRLGRDAQETIGQVTLAAEPFRTGGPLASSALGRHENLGAAEGDLETDSPALSGAAGPTSPKAEPREAFSDDTSGGAQGPDRSPSGDRQPHVAQERSPPPAGLEGIDYNERQQLPHLPGSDAARGVQDVPSRSASIANPRHAIVPDQNTVADRLQEEPAHGAEDRITAPHTEFAAGLGHEGVAEPDSTAASLLPIRATEDAAGQVTGGSSTTAPETGFLNGTHGKTPRQEPQAARSHDSVADSDKSARLGTAMESIPATSDTGSSTDVVNTVPQNPTATGTPRKRRVERRSSPVEPSQSATSLEAGLESGRTERGHAGAEATPTTRGGVNEASTGDPEARAQGGDPVHSSAGQGRRAFDEHGTKHRDRGMPTGPATPDDQPTTPLDLVSQSQGDAYVDATAGFGAPDVTATGEDNADDDRLSALPSSADGHTRKAGIRYSDAASAAGDGERPNGDHGPEVRVDDNGDTDIVEGIVTLGGGASDDDPTDTPVTPPSTFSETASHAQSFQRGGDFEPSPDRTPEPSDAKHNYPDALDPWAGDVRGLRQDADRDLQGRSGVATALSGWDGAELLHLAIMLLGDPDVGEGIDERQATALVELPAMEESRGRLLALVLDLLMVPKAAQVPPDAARGSSFKPMTSETFRSKRASAASTADTNPSPSKAREGAEAETEAAASDTVRGGRPSVTPSSAQGARNPKPSDPMPVVRVAERLAEATPFASLGMQEALGLIWSALPASITQDRTAQRVLLGATAAIAAEEGEGLATLRWAVHDLLATSVNEAERRLAARMAFARMRYAAAGSPRARMLARTALTAIMPGLADSHPDQQIALATNVAGLVLFAPYLRMLFDRGGVLDPEGRIPAAHLPRARALLTGLSSSATLQPDPLERVLLGLVPGQPIAPCTADDELAALSDGLVRAVIAQWGALGKTSPDGLRQAFIRREGDLIPEADGAVRLRVLPGPFDMLLDRLPWSFAVIRTPWMLGPLHVRWRSDDNR